MALHERPHVMQCLLITLLFVLSAFAVPLSDSTPSSRWKHLALKTKGSFLTDIHGAPFFWQADTAWELFHRLNHSEVIHYLDDRQAKGYNIIMSVAIPEYKYVFPVRLTFLFSTLGLMRLFFYLFPPIYSVTLPNRNGDLALIDFDPTQPNPAYFDYVDWCIDRATERGLRIALVPTWGRYINGGVFLTLCLRSFCATPASPIMRDE